MEDREHLRHPTNAEACTLAGGSLLAVGGMIIAGFDDTPKQQVDNLKQDTASLKAEIAWDAQQIKVNQHKIKAVKAQNPNLNAPGIPLGSEIVGGGGLLCLVVGGLSWGYRALKLARWERNAIKAGQNPS